MKNLVYGLSKCARNAQLFSSLLTRNDYNNQELLHIVPCEDIHQINFVILCYWEEGRIGDLKTIVLMLVVEQFQAEIIISTQTETDTVRTSRQQTDNFGAMT